MRLKRIKKITAIILALSGLGMIVVACFAYNLGLDNNPTMGAQRKLMALGGVACILLSAASSWLANFSWTGMFPNISGWYSSTIARVKQITVFKWLEQFGQGAQGSAPARWLRHHPGIWAVTGTLLVIVISAWYITSGLWKWTPASHYFDLQADAFLSGSLSLLQEPPAQLLALPNPYDYHSREGLGYLWDSSLYHGHYYLYWGPVPALLAALIKLIHPTIVEDQHLVLIFICGLTILLAALLHWLRKTFYPNAPAWTVLLLTLAGGLCAPLLWLVNRPSVYEAAIAGGVFFLLAGLYASLRALVEWPSRTSNAWLLCAGLAWGASAGCRLNNVAAVGWLAGLTTLYLAIQGRKPTRWFLPALCLSLPLFAWAAGLGWYNLARFGSLTETGHRYQLTGPALPSDYNLVISARYALPSLYNYLFRPLAISWREFPFIYAPNIKESMWPRFIQPPAHYYYGEPVAGLLTAIPILWLLCLPLIKPLRKAWNWAHERPATTPVQLLPTHPLLARVWWLLAGAVVFNFGLLLVFITSTMRYLADVAPLLTLLAGLCLWWALCYLGKPGWKRLLLALFIILGLASIFIGMIASLHIVEQRFETNNPALFHTVAHFFSRQP